MSDVMLFGVLRMPYDMAMSDDLSRRQFYARAQQAAAELEALRAELVEQARVCGMGSEREARLMAERDELRTRLEAAERDAARYRWLRDLSTPPHNFYVSVPIEFDGVRYAPSDVDAYIDAAMQPKEQQAQKGEGV